MQYTGLVKVVLLHCSFDKLKKSAHQSELQQANKMGCKKWNPEKECVQLLTVRSQRNPSVPSSSVSITDAIYGQKINFFVLTLDHRFQHEVVCSDIIFLGCAKVSCFLMIS